MREGFYKIDDFNIGDEVAFKGSRSQSDYDQMWEVIGKANGRLQIKTLEIYAPFNYWTIELNEVLHHTPKAKKI